MLLFNGFPRFFHSVRGQRGMALLVVVCLLAMMSLLGFFALDTTDVELTIASNYRARQQAFYAAERAVEYAMTSASLYSTIGADAVPLTEDHAAVIAADTANSGLKAGEVCQVEYLSTGPLPPESGSDPTCFAARTYRISVIGEGPAGTTARVEAQVARVVPK